MTRWDDSEVFADDDYRNIFNDVQGEFEEPSEESNYYASLFPMPISLLQEGRKALAILAFTTVLTAPLLVGDTYASKINDSYLVGAAQTKTPFMIQDISVEFAKHSMAWKSACRLVSSTDVIAANPSYRAIIRLGLNALPYILSELEKEPNHWFRALKEITHEDPVQPSERGRVKLMAKAWLEWGKKRGYQW